MTGRAAHPLAGRWSIVSADLWGRDYLDLSGPATIDIGTDGAGEIGFGALTASLDISFSSRSIDFTWAGSDEGDQVEGDGGAELLDDGSLSITFAWHNGDEAILTAERNTSSTAC